MRYNLSLLCAIFLCMTRPLKSMHEPKAHLVVAEILSELSTTEYEPKRKRTIQKPKSKIGKKKRKFMCYLCTQSYKKQIHFGTKEQLLHHTNSSTHLATLKAHTERACLNCMRLRDTGRASKFHALYGCSSNSNQ